MEFEDDCHGGGMQNAKTKSSSSATQRNSSGICQKKHEFFEKSTSSRYHKVRRKPSSVESSEDGETTHAQSIARFLAIHDRTVHFCNGSLSKSAHLFLRIYGRSCHHSLRKGTSLRVVFTSLIQQLLLTGLSSHLWR